MMNSQLLQREHTQRCQTRMHGKESGMCRCSKIETMDAEPPRSCDEGTLRILEESNAPRFEKTLTRTMLQSSERVGIPAWFIHEHGDRLHTVLSLTGPTGNPRPVMCIVRATGTRPRVYLGQEWLPFAQENGFQTGDHVVFHLVARSSFRVLATPEHHCPLNCNPADDSSLRLQSQRRTFHLPKTEYVKYAGLTSAVNSISKLFPHFVKKLGPNHLNGRHMGMELPWAFVKEHGDKFRARVGVRGASGHVSVVRLRVAVFCGTGRVHLARGWKEFALAHGFSPGDVLLFSLVGHSMFEVHMFPEAAES